MSSNSPEPVLHDRYGFKRTFDAVSQEDQDRFDREYREIERRRSQKWAQLLLRNKGELPPKSDKVKRYIRKGIPKELRARSWYHYCGADKLREENPAIYVALTYREFQDRQQGYTKETNKVLEWIEILERDVHRTFPENTKFQVNRAESQSIPRIPTPTPKASSDLSLVSSVDDDSDSSIVDSDSDFDNVPSEGETSRPSRSKPAQPGQANDNDEPESPWYRISPTEHLTPVERLQRSPSRSNSAHSIKSNRSRRSRSNSQRQSGDDKLAAEVPPPPVPSIPVWELNPYLCSLRRILAAFAYYSWPHPDPARALPHPCSYNIGYCQSLNFIVGMLLLVYGEGEPGYAATTPLSKNDTRIDVEEKVFWTLVVIVDQLLPKEMYGNTLEGTRIEQEILWRWILGQRGSKFGVGRVAKWVDHMETSEVPRSPKIRAKDRANMGQGGSGMPPLSMVTTQWFMTLFINVLPVETALRVWDCFFYQGEKVLMRVALTLLKIHEEQILAFEDPLEAWKFVKDMPQRMYDCHRLLEICFKPRHPINPFEETTTMQLENEDGARRSTSVKVRRGVGTVSTKLIEKYRELAIEERKSTTGPEQQ
ncbi:uncharacterized protein BJ171DRAFT_278147 [Polychytrium aggregatum]|uniref:uncharacterized protein n=1 Tax=Polychytrium aggregatum TaxID=110093 RepID=UPI0022FDBDDC|nr:uncharacterized protein BJ171DRAFT_278147 [Polychytrium aggregatum]KAI9207598.1 hypothetical protein BJ171DRAFT_278147 [Polychytrium aggregatum]